MVDLTGRTALVTAGAAGIGQATVWVLSECGANVVAADIDSRGLEETLREARHPERIRTVIADATTEEGAAAAVQEAIDSFGALHILANVVGGSRPGRTVVEETLEQWEFWVRLNLTSTFLMCRAAIPRMAESGGGAIVNISSGAGQTGMRRNPAYVAAKAGVIGLTRSLAIDHAAQRIRANCITPGAILTPLMRRNRKPEEIELMSKMNLVGRLGDPRDIANTVAFLVSDEGAFINGEVINVAGGHKAGV